MLTPCRHVTSKRQTHRNAKNPEVGSLTTLLSGTFWMWYVKREISMLGLRGFIIFEEETQIRTVKQLKRNKALWGKANNYTNIVLYTLLNKYIGIYIYLNMIYVHIHLYIVYSRRVEHFPLPLDRSSGSKLAKRHPLTSWDALSSAKGDSPPLRLEAKTQTNPSHTPGPN